ncbi:MAG TPA: class I SAM-dependent methyltransferase [Gammaproteobacteria bacterium]|nr:class I SAM-dependent methyltransferase [Gammaproteobacteria bacterium]
MVGPPGAWQPSAEFPLAFLSRHGLASHHRLLEIGCGVLRGGIHLIRYMDAGCYVGIDIRPEAINEAHREIANHKLAAKNPVVFVTDNFGIDLFSSPQFDYVLAFQVFYHLQDNLVGDCLRATAEYMRPGATLYANVNVVQEPGVWQEFPYVQRPLEFYESLCSGTRLEMNVLGQLAEFGYSNRLAGRTNHMLAFVKQ